MRKIDSNALFVRDGIITGMNLSRESRCIGYVRRMLRRVRLSERYCQACFISSAAARWSGVTSTSILLCLTSTFYRTSGSSYRRIEVSKLYYERQYADAPANTLVALSFASMLRDLCIPPLAQHDAFNDALMTAMMDVVLRNLKERGARIARTRSSAAVFNPTAREAPQLHDNL